MSITDSGTSMSSCGGLFSSLPRSASSCSTASGALSTKSRAKTPASKAEMEVLDFLGPPPVESSEVEGSMRSTSSLFYPLWEAASSRNSSLSSVKSSSVSVASDLSARSSPFESERSTPTPTPTHESNWPMFPGNEIAAEQESIKYLTDFLADGIVTTLGLYHKIAEAFGVMNKPCPFASAVYLQDFISKRSHIFHYSIISSKITRCGFGYMKGIMRIVQYLHDVSNKFGRCSFETLFNGCIVDLPVYDRNEKLWNDEEVFDYPPTMEEALELLTTRHSDIFIVTGNRMDISLKPDVFKIPSFWISSCLPEKPVGDTFWDRSRKYTFSAYVVSSMKIYAKAVIQSGKYANRSIYILAAHIGAQEKDLSSYIPTSTMLTVRARFCLNAKCDFTAENIVIHGESKYKSRSQVDVNKVMLESLAGPSSSGQSALPVNDPQDMLFARRALDAERDRINYMDALLDMKSLTPAEVEHRYMSNMSPLFPLTADLGRFITSRPHLYICDDDFAFARQLKNSERELCRNFISFLSRYRHGLTFMEIKQKLKGNEAGTALQLLSLQEEFICWLERLDGFVMGKIDLENKSVFVLRGAYSAAEKLFVPNLPQSYLP